MRSPLLGGLTSSSQVAAAQALAGVCEARGIDRATRAIDD